ncbi:MAG: hypothetical protein JW883_05585 [Deltaproteobacteria bacterium]|nr:hypothetical protein [Deltaproteobacteria bacterium]
MTKKQFLNSLANTQVDVLQQFLNAISRKAMVYEMKVAALQDVLGGKIWAILMTKGARVSDKKIWLIFFVWSRHIRT